MTENPPTASPYNGGQPPYPPRPPYGPPAPFAPPPPPKKKGMSTGKIVLLSILGVCVLCLGSSVLLAATGGGGDDNPNDVVAADDGTSQSASAAPHSGKTKAAAPAKKTISPTPTKPKAKPKVTFKVSGSTPSGVDITYGSDSDNRQGGDSAPWSATLNRDDSGDTQWYSITAQLQGGGDITCTILVDGKAIASGHASGGYNICQAQIIQGWTGTWKKV
ncbi:MmpS family transport accessory protein [Actinocatenispora comari]|jgi:hypothetical protein|uniref:MmpS family membrane protein n=1 Tax=Actinocatenispora comari TaxID=2807577 RepID=A0A8J4ACF8_9ACTN|nr:hypothetical protein [Actinocatenispora comari]GIL28140.1 hypothetical protein NUM_33940 [Actinocatenispora comari]